MANRPMKPCSKHGCPNLSRAKYCEEHAGQDKQSFNYTNEQKKEYDKQRPSAAKRGYDSKWRTYRIEFLKRNPKCVQCGETATIVDHILPHKGNKGLFWTRFNHQSLCASCHSRKTIKHDMGAWK